MIYKLLKWIFGLLSGALSVLLLLYLGIKNEDWTIKTSEGQVLIPSSMGFFLIGIWAIVGVLFLLFEYLYKRKKSSEALK